MNRKKIFRCLAVFLLISFICFTRTTLVTNAANGTVNEAEIKEKIKSAWDNHETKIEFGSIKVQTSDYKRIYYELLYTNPEYFYVSSYIYYQYSGAYVTRATVTYESDDVNTINKQKSEYAQAIEAFKKTVDNSWSDLEKIIYINNYICRACEYDKTIKKDNIYDAYGALVNHTAVCEGYSMAFKALADQVGISSCLVSSDSLGHAWNMVKLNGKYYMLDVTWDDSEGDFRGISTQYLLKSLSWFNSSAGGHVANDYKIKGIGPDPSAANDTQYDKASWSGRYNYIFLVNGGLYGTDGSGKIVKYSCDGKTVSIERELIDLSEKKWIIKGKGSYYTVQTGLVVSSLGDKLYYSLPESIMQYNVKTGESKEVYTLTDNEKSNNVIYGIAITYDNKLKYFIANDVNYDGTYKEVPVTYKAEYNWNSDYSGAKVSITTMPLDFVTVVNQSSVEKNKKAATCTATGSVTYTVTVTYNGQKYSDSKDVTLKALGHNMSEHKAKDAKCTTDGNSRYWSCDRCNKYFSDKNGSTSIKENSWVIKAPGHEYGSLIAKVPATCKSEGKEAYYKCSKCSKLFDTNHNEKTDIQLVINKLNHKYEVVKGTEEAPTCTKAGKEADKKCALCNDVIKGAVKAALGHHWDDGVITKEATTDEEGIKTFTCYECKLTRTENIPVMKEEPTEAPTETPTETKTEESTGSSSEGFAETPTDTPSGKSEDTPSGKNRETPAGTSTEANQNSGVTSDSDASGDNSSIIIDSDGQTYYILEKLSDAQVKKDIRIADKKTNGKYKITKIIRKNGRIVSGTVTYMAPYNKSCKKATIPAYIKIRGVKFTVTSVNKGAFKNNKKLKSITIGANVTVIGANAFSGCSKLSNINIKTTKLKKIGSKAFKGINKKAKIKVPKKRLTKYKKMLYKAGVSSKSKITK